MIRQLVEEVYKEKFAECRKPMLFSDVDKLIIFDAGRQQGIGDMVKVLEIDDHRFMLDIKVWASDNGFELSSGVGGGRAFARVYKKGVIDEVRYASGMYREMTALIQAALLILEIIKKEKCEEVNEKGV